MPKLTVNNLKTCSLKDNVKLLFKKMNIFLKDKSGIIDFFATGNDFIQFKENLIDRQ